MSEKLSPTHRLSFPDAISNSKVAFNLNHLLHALVQIKPNINPQDYKKELPKIGSEALANQLVAMKIYDHITPAWEDVCKMRRFKSGMQDK